MGRQFSRFASGFMAAMSIFVYYCGLFDLGIICAILAVLFQLWSKDTD